MDFKRVTKYHDTMTLMTIYDFMDRGVQTTVVPYLDFEPESVPTIKSYIPKCDGLIWNTKHKLTGEILDLAGL